MNSNCLAPKDFELKLPTQALGSQTHFLLLPQKKVFNLGGPGWFPDGRPGCGAWGGGDGTVIYCAGVALYMIEVGTIEECFLHEG